MGRIENDVHATLETDAPSVAADRPALTAKDRRRRQRPAAAGKDSSPARPYPDRMDWVCTDCGQTYHESPMDCQLCGHDVVPADDPRATTTFREQLWLRFLDPRGSDTSLVTDGPYFVWTVRALFVATLLLLAVVLLG
jgi:hypothetical protein